MYRRLVPSGYAPVCLCQGNKVLRSSATTRRSCSTNQIVSHIAQRQCLSIRRVDGIHAHVVANIVISRRISSLPRLMFVFHQRLIPPTEPTPVLPQGKGSTSAADSFSSATPAVGARTKTRTRPQVSRKISKKNLAGHCRALCHVIRPYNLRKEGQRQDAVATTQR